jgi:hypothetical protein
MEPRVLEKVARHGGVRWTGMDAPFSMLKELRGSLGGQGLSAVDDWAVKRWPRCAYEVWFAAAKREPGCAS